MEAERAMLYRIAGSLALLALAPALLSMISRLREPALGLHANRLFPCPARPNCVCSEYPGQNAAIAPLDFAGEGERAWARAAWAVRKMGGQVLREENGYLHAIFRSRFYRFIDDLELRLDREHSVIHLRSAARAGYSDFGVNRNRAEQLQALFQAP
jgi:uncharacterized protein (DUF1499 family)